MSEGHYRVADELQLGLKLSILLGEPFSTRACPGVIRVVGGRQTLWMPTMEMIFPELWNDKGKLMHLN